MSNGWASFDATIYTSFRISLSSDLITIKRKTDSLLDWLGDCGGLMDSLHFLAELLVNSF